MGLFSEIGDSFRELGQIFKDFGDEMQEIIVDGSKEMLINGESHYETSVEIREEADEIKKQADCLLYDKRKLVEQKFANADIMQNKVLSSRQKVLRDAPIIVRDKLKRIALNLKILINHNCIILSSLLSVRTHNSCLFFSDSQRFQY